MAARSSNDLGRAATFVRVVEASSFSAAASALGLPTSSVSRSVAKLENVLGVRLLERTTRRVALTDAGRVFYERAREAVVALDDASALASEAAREPQGMVRVAAPLEMATLMAAIVAEFLSRWPKIQVDVTFASRGEELVGSSVDIALVTGRLADSALIVRKLGTTVHKLYAAPSYIERRGTPRALADLARHDAVLYRCDDGAATWELIGPRGAESVVVRGRVSADQLMFVLEAASGGLGIALVPEFFAERAVADDHLRPILPRYSCEGALQSLVHPSRHQPQRVTILRDFLTQRLTQLPCNTRHAAR